MTEVRVVLFAGSLSTSRNPVFFAKSAESLRIKVKAPKENAWGNVEGEFGHPAGGG
jgi:hypothetical protein